MKIEKGMVYKDIPLKTLLMTLVSSLIGFFFLLFFFISSLSGCAWTRSADEAVNGSVYRKARRGVVSVSPGFRANLKNYFSENSASGTVIDDNGTVLTNFHAVRKSELVTVRFFDGSVWRGRVTGRDPDNDLAMIQVSVPKEKLFPIPLGDSERIRVGEKVLAIGNPFGLTGTLSVGIVSSLGRSIDSKSGGRIRGLIQTDTSINPGSSGGPLLNTRGEMIGLNTALLKNRGGNVGIAFSLPVNAIKKVIPDLLEKGYVPRSWAGILGRFIDSGLAAELGLPSPGILVSDVLRNSPAEKSGLTGGVEVVRVGPLLIAKGGDLILSYDGYPATDVDGFHTYVESRKPGERIVLRISRGSTVESVGITLTEKPRGW